MLYPGLADHPQHELAQRQMSGFGAMITFETGSLKNANRMLKKVQMCSLGESLGGVETLISHPATMTHAGLGEKGRKAIGITDGMVRISVGIEDSPTFSKIWNPAWPRYKAFLRISPASFYSAFSDTQREIAVTNFRGANLTDSATSQFRPGDHQRPPRHQPAVSIPRNLCRAHRPELCKQARILRARPFREPSLGSSRTKAANHHSRPRYFIRQRFRKRKYIGLARVVHRHQRPRLKSRGGSHIHNLPTAARQHRPAEITE